MAVREVQRRGQQLDQKRKLQAKAYSDVKSKVARNMKVIDNTNRELGYRANPYNSPKKRRPQSDLYQSLRIKKKNVSPVKLDDSHSWFTDGKNYQQYEGIDFEAD